jgi:hypothetical protein
MLGQGVLNWTFPDALHVTGAVWSAQKAGVLPMPDAERLVARGAARKQLDEQAYKKADAALHAWGEALSRIDTGADGDALSLVLIEPMLWTRFVRAGEVVEMQCDVNGSEAGDLVLITDVPVLHAIDEGTMSIAEAIEMELVRLYGTPEQKRRFIESCGTIGDRPLSEARAANGSTARP